VTQGANLRVTHTHDLRRKWTFAAGAVNMGASAKAPPWGEELRASSRWHRMHDEAVSRELETVGRRGCFALAAPKCQPGLR
jgi:hypothetical protein